MLSSQKLILTLLGLSVGPVYKGDLKCTLNLGIDIRHVYKPMWMVHIYIFFFI
jgi:hypothetical protein